MTRWAEVPLHALALGEDIAAGDRVPGRIVALDAYRRAGAADGFVVDAPAHAIDWRGLEQALAWLDTQDVVARVRAEA